MKCSTHDVAERLSDSETVCRICLQSEQLVSLFSPLTANIRINEALAICVGLEIFREQDSPSGNEICSDCLKQLEATYNFRKLCWASQHDLKYTQSSRSDRKASLHCYTKKIETSESPDTHLQSNFESNSPGFETIYEFVDTNPMANDRTPLQCDNEKETVDERDEPKKSDECTKPPSDHVAKLKNFQCSICMKKFRKSSRYAHIIGRMSFAFLCSEHRIH